ncbi:MAG TPA: hypothetical protein VFI19_01210 [Nocardioides sp.]|nr:hypothetical protein [Nocardioides sp.]
MKTITSRRRRYSRRAAAIAAIAVVAFGAACGNEVAKDVAPAAPAPAPHAQVSPHPPTSPDAAEQRGHADGADHSTFTPGGHEIYIP